MGCEKNAREKDQNKRCWMRWTYKSTTIRKTENTQQSSGSLQVSGNKILII